MLDISLRVEQTTATITTMNNSDHQELSKVEIYKMKLLHFVTQKQRPCAYLGILITFVVYVVKDLTLVCSCWSSNSKILITMHYLEFTQFMDALYYIRITLVKK